MKKIIKHYPMTDRLIVRRGYSMIVSFIIKQETSDLSLVTGKLYHLKLYWVHVHLTAGMNQTFN